MLGRFDSERAGPPVAALQRCRTVGEVGPGPQTVVKCVGVGVRAGVAHINVTLRRQRRYKETRQFHSPANPHPNPPLSSHLCPSQLVPDFLCLNL